MRRILRKLATVLTVAILSLTSLFANDTPFTRKGSGPKYWIAYEYCWQNNLPIPEDRWKKNIDWMVKNFKSYGYDMICNDGWIETAQTINSNGYVLKYNDDWKHTFEYWGKYLKSQGMKMGVYYNPMWLTKASFNARTKVKGSNKSSNEIVGEHSFNDALYWVDTDKEGAKEWIQGYVQYFIDIGATFLRIDFLENYEKNYGTTKYLTALKWIKEAAGDKIFLSLVMPNCFNHAQSELVYGDMIRIDDDCFDGGWDFISNRRRGEQRQIWPQYGNAFDGFIGFADIGGHGQMVLDGDFLRLNTFSSDKERRFAFSLMVISGSPLAIADQFDTMNGHEWVYQNKSLLDIHDQGFVGKPLSFKHNEIDKSSVWAGQLPNGDWVVGLFNREETNQLRKIDFIRDLGISPNQNIELFDLWTNKSLQENGSGYSVELPARDCQILLIKNPRKKYELEFSSMVGGAKRGDREFNFEGLSYVSDFNTDNSQIILPVEASEKRNHQIKIRYKGTPSNTFKIIINNKELETIQPENSTSWTYLTVNTSLEKGINYIQIKNKNNRNQQFFVDNLEII